MMVLASGWTRERVATLRQMWPSHTAAEIAERLSITRNAVIGKANRLGLEDKSAFQGQGAPSHPKIDEAFRLAMTSRIRQADAARVCGVNSKSLASAISRARRNWKIMKRRLSRTA